MSKWGFGLYQNDLAEDIKIDYYKYLREDELNNQEAYDRLLKTYKNEIQDSEDGPLFWLVLADLMWDLGKLNDEVRGKAFYFIGLQSIEDDDKEECSENEKNGIRP